MINEQMAKRYCYEDISRIPNYEQAIADTTQVWDLHHRLELTVNGEFAHTPQELIEMDMYYNRPAGELIFLTHAEHNRLHRNAERSNPEYRAKRSEAQKQRWADPEYRAKQSETQKQVWANPELRAKQSEANIRSEFGRKYKEHFKINPYADPKQYNREHMYFSRHGFCRWEK